MERSAQDVLTAALKQAEKAHGVYEKELGRADPDWPQWYAEHMVRSLAEEGYELHGPLAPLR